MLTHITYSRTNHGIFRIESVIARLLTMITTKWLTLPGMINFENSTPTSNLEHSDHTSYESSEWTSPYRSLYHKDIRRSTLDIVWLVAVEIEL